MEAWTVEMIVGAALAVSGAIRWGAGVIAKAITGHGEEVKAHRAALVDNTHAVQMNNQLRDKEQHRSGLMKKAAMLLLLPLLLLGLSGCPSVSKQTAEDMRFAQTAWEEDRRQDLEPEVVTARRVFFRTAIETADKGAGK